VFLRDDRRRRGDDHVALLVVNAGYPVEDRDDPIGNVDGVERVEKVIFVARAKGNPDDRGHDRCREVDQSRKKIVDLCSRLRRERQSQCRNVGREQRRRHLPRLKREREAKHSLVQKIGATLIAALNEAQQPVNTEPSGAED